ncbi:MAG: diacylglycerol kinase [Wolinella sp.]
MRNQPKYNLFKNSSYALKGLRDLVQNETSFRLELLLIVVAIPVIFILQVGLVEKLLLFVTLMGIPLAEAINSAIERVVDLVTLDYHELAGRAKDIGSSVVFLSFVIFLITWGGVLINVFFNS